MRSLGCSNPARRQEAYTANQAIPIVGLDQETIVDLGASQSVGLALAQDGSLYRFDLSIDFQNPPAAITATELVAPAGVTRLESFMDNAGTAQSYAFASDGVWQIQELATPQLLPDSMGVVSIGGEQWLNGNLYLLSVTDQGEVQRVPTGNTGTQRPLYIPR